MTAALKLPAPLYSDEQLIALEDALGDYQAAASEYEDGLGSKGVMTRAYGDLFAVCLDMGMGPKSDAELWAKGVVQ